MMEKRTVKTGRDTCNSAALSPLLGPLISPDKQSQVTANEVRSNLRFQNQLLTSETIQLASAD